MAEARKTIRITGNSSAKEYKEFEQMVSIQVLDDNLSLTDFIFNNDRSLKFIKSELSKDELKKLMLKVIDEHYEKYK
jgi:hypothetical protein